MNKLKRLLLIALFFGAANPVILAQAELVTHKPPVYPLAARAEGIQGPVTLKGTISKEGKMGDVHVISGPPELRQAAINAVSGWTYKPYRHLGRIVTVDTTVTVNFAMGKTPAETAQAQAKAKAELAAQENAAKSPSRLYAHHLPQEIWHHRLLAASTPSLAATATYDPKSHLKGRRTSMITAARTIKLKSLYVTRCLLEITGVLLVILAAFSCILAFALLQGRNGGDGLFKVVVGGSFCLLCGVGFLLSKIWAKFCASLVLLVFRVRTFLVDVFRSSHPGFYVLLVIPLLLTAWLQYGYSSSQLRRLPSVK